MSHICRQCSAVGFVSYELVIVDSRITAEYRCHRCGFSWRTAQNGEHPEPSEHTAADALGDVRLKPDTTYEGTLLSRT